MFFHRTVTRRKIILVAFLGAVLNSICFLLPFVLWCRLMLGAFITGGISIGLLFTFHCGFHTYIKNLVIALEMGVLLGGSIALLQKFIVRKEFTTGEMVLITLVLSFALKILLQKFFFKRQSLYYPIALFCDGFEYRMNAFLDTGNSLIEPISGKEVCLVGKDYFEQQVKKEGERKVFQPQRFRAIPYHAVGTPNGILGGYEMDRLIIYTDERKIEIQKPVIGISEHSVGSPDSYQMILQPGLLGEGVK